MTDTGLWVHFSEDLAFFLSKKKDPFFVDVSRWASVKDIVESLGVPHTEVGTLTFNGQPVDFGFIPERAGTLRVGGFSSPRDVTADSALRPNPLPGIRFIADLNVLKLGRYLLFLGYDTCLARDLDDAAIADLAQEEGRIVLTRDTRLLFRKKIVFARRLRSNLAMDQLAEVVGCFGLRPDPNLFFTRCTRCNVRLQSVEKEGVYHLLEPKTRKYVSQFCQCPRCLGVFWKGSHYRAVERRFYDHGLLPLISFL